jgi:hypothetical protein
MHRVILDSNNTLSNFERCDSASTFYVPMYRQAQEIDVVFAEALCRDGNNITSFSLSVSFPIF